MYLSFMKLYKYEWQVLSVVAEYTLRTDICMYHS
uniref:Uncharacterized protein n=1 Tax=Setaria italica TaxID=4555 RepID=K3ZP74_SETIT